MEPPSGRWEILSNRHITTDVNNPAITVKAFGLPARTDLVSGRFGPVKENIPRPSEDTGCSTVPDQVKGTFCADAEITMASVSNRGSANVRS